MIEIVAKDYPHFYNILREYNISEEKAIFVPWQTVKITTKEYPPSRKINVTKDDGDWCCDFRAYC